MCVRLRALNRGSDAPIFFFRSLFWDGEEPVTQHTPCACTQMSRGGELFENTLSHLPKRCESNYSAAERGGR